MKYTVINSNAHLGEDFKEYAVHIPFLYDHRKEIYSNAEYFYALLPFTVLELKNQVCIGAYLKASERGEPFHVINEDSNTEEFIACFAGSPMSGISSGYKTVLNVADRTIQMCRFKDGSFNAMRYQLKVNFQESQLPYHESSLTLHDVIRQLEERDENSVFK